MRKLVTVLILVLFVTIAAAQATAETRLEVAAAIAFTEGFTVDCPASLLEASDYAVCVNTSQLSWSDSSMRTFATYGLGGWVVLIPWKFDGDLYSYGAAHTARRELLLIAYSPASHMLIYMITATP